MFTVQDFGSSRNVKCEQSILTAMGRKPDEINPGGARKDTNGEIPEYWLYSSASPKVNLPQTRLGQAAKFDIMCHQVN